MYLVSQNQQSQFITNLAKLFLKENKYDEAIKCLEIGSNCGYQDSIIELATMYMNGNCVEKDIKKAKNYFKLLSNKYNSYIAQYQLGMIYNKEKKYSKSFKYFELSGNQEYPDALMKIGIIYRDGLGVKRNPKKTYESFEKAAKLGRGDAFFYLGVFCRDGFGTTKNNDRAIRYYKISASYGIEEAMNNLGLYYAKNDQFELAKYYWGNTNNAKTQYNLGVIYCNEGKYLKAKEMFEKAAEQGHTDSLVSIGKLYLYGDGVEEDIDIALDYIIRAARLHNPTANRIINDTLNDFVEYEERTNRIIKKESSKRQT